MPDFDSGHIFLTALAPILPGAPAHNPRHSHEQRARIALAALPTAKQSPATQASNFNSPFARNRQNHFVRLFVLNNVVYNGRTPENPIVGLVRRTNLLTPQPIDRLKASYVVFCADVDAVMAEGEPLPEQLNPSQQQAVRAAYARRLWDTMAEELARIYSNCYGFDGVETADDFAAYLERCHVETTMPFHDYYLDKPQFHTIPLVPLAGIVALPFLLALVSLISALFGASSLPLLGWPPFPTWLISTLCGTALAFILVRYILHKGEKPVPPAEFDDLPSVLKALYIQQKFADFFAENQGLPPAKLQAAFADFVQTHQPENRDQHTQKPGVISSADVSNVLS